MTEKQIIFLKYLTQKIGFMDDNFFTEYIRLLEILAPKFSSLFFKKDNSVENIEEEIIFKKNVIDVLLYEVDLKKNESQIKRQFESNSITATDIANYTYCPISYSIGRTYKIPTNAGALVGQELHERKWLINVINRKFKKSIAEREVEDVEFKTEQLEKSENKFFFNDIKLSKAIYQGHIIENSHQKYFINGRYRGSPDYIFFNEKTKQYFVVEEKYQWIPKKLSRYRKSSIPEEAFETNSKMRNKLIFYPNHKNQLLSYIYWIPDYKIDYGYLVYWKYEMQDHSPYIVGCNVLKIDKTNENREILIDKYKELLLVIKNNGGDFNPLERSAKKCAGCSNGLLCGHKTGHYNNYTIPYDPKFIKLRYVEFPNILKKSIQKIPSENEVKD